MCWSKVPFVVGASELDGLNVINGVGAWFATDCAGWLVCEDAASAGLVGRVSVLRFVDHRELVLTITQ